MAAPELPELPQGLPWWMYYWQYILGAAMVSGGVIAAAIREFIKGKNEGRAETAPTHVVLEQAELADMAAVRGLSQVLEAVPGAVGALATKLDAVAPKVDANSGKLDSILMLMDMDRRIQGERAQHLDQEVHDMKERLEKIDRNVEFIERDRRR